MNAEPNPLSYKSPRGKLLRFFQRSRDQWKAKCLVAKVRLKQLKQRLGYLEQSKQAWKASAQQQATELAELRARLAQTDAALAELKKKQRPASS